MQSIVAAQPQTTLSLFCYSLFCNQPLTPELRSKSVLTAVAFIPFSYLPPRLSDHEREPAEPSPALGLLLSPPYPSILQPWYFHV
jgi:hypothetical protein